MLKYTFITLVLFFYIKNISSKEQLLLYHHMTFEEKVITLNDGSTFNNFNAVGVWEDNNGNYGPANCQGVRMSNGNNKLISLNIICQHNGVKEEKFWSLSKRETGKDGGIGSVTIIDTTKFFDSYRNYKCTYAVSFEKNIYIAKSKCN